MKKGPYYYGRQMISEADIRAVSDTLRSAFLSQGPKLAELEKRMAEYCGAGYCLAVSNGTAGLHLACLALGLEQGDEAWTSPLSFVASANCIRYCGAQAGFVDIDLDTLNISPENLEQGLKKASTKNKCPKILIPVHFAGQSCNMEEISKLAAIYNYKIIEDACHSLGGTYNNKKIGSCSHSDITVFSLHPVKSITSGEGGLILTNDKNLYEQMKEMRGHGVARSQDGDVPWQAESLSLGFNYKISELHCALALSQLDRLDEFINRRRTLVSQYMDLLAPLPVRFQSQVSYSESAWHLMILLMDFRQLGLPKVEFYSRLKKRGIHLSVHYYPIHLHRSFCTNGCQKGKYPNAEAYYEAAFSLPLHPGLCSDDVAYICSQIKEALKERMT